MYRTLGSLRGEEQRQLLHTHATGDVFFLEEESVDILLVLYRYGYRWWYLPPRTRLQKTKIFVYEIPTVKRIINMSGENSIIFIRL